MVYLITYDLKQKGQDYPELYKAIKEFDEYVHPMEYVWLISTDKTSKDIINSLSNVIDDNDLIFVTEISYQTCASNMDEINTNWIKGKASKLWD